MDRRLLLQLINDDNSTMGKKNILILEIGSKRAYCDDFTAYNEAASLPWNSWITHILLNYELWIYNTNAKFTTINPGYNWDSTYNNINIYIIGPYGYSSFALNDSGLHACTQLPLTGSVWDL